MGVCLQDHNVAAGGGEGGTAAWTSDPEAETFHSIAVKLHRK